jgi:hypothetical protein
LAEVAVDDDDLIDGPAERDGALPQRILPLRALRVFEHLPQGGLADVEIRRATQMTRCDFLGDRRMRHEDTSEDRTLSAICVHTCSRSACRSGSTADWRHGAVRETGAMDRAACAMRTHAVRPRPMSTPTPTSGSRVPCRKARRQHSY